MSPGTFAVDSRYRGGTLSPKCGCPSVKQASGSVEVIRFGVFEADPRTGELLKQGRRVGLQEQPFQVLAFLLARPGELVTRDELRSKLWPSDTFVDFEHGLNKAISKVREALGDDSGTPRYVETLPRRGYRFISPVTVAPMRTRGQMGHRRRRRLCLIQVGHPLHVGCAGCRPR
jgi:DNA-binding winged helix-turn-helix (wHTH) protein